MAHSDTMCAVSFVVPKYLIDQKKIDDLLRALRASKEFDGELVSQLDIALKENGGASKELLIKLLGDSLPAIRYAAVEACRARKEIQFFSSPSSFKKIFPFSVQQSMKLDIVQHASLRRR